VGIVGVVGVPRLFVGHALVRVGFVGDVMVAAANDERQVAGQQAFGLGRVVEPQPCVSATASYRGCMNEQHSTTVAPENATAWSEAAT
jgi:hypothetical protein